MRSSIFRDVTERGSALSHRRFEKPCRSHIQESSSLKNQLYSSWALELLWDVTWCRFVVSNRRFGTTYR